MYGNGFGRSYGINLSFTKGSWGSLNIFYNISFMLYGVTENSLYLLLGLGGGSAAAWIAYRLFYHVQVRVLAWKILLIILIKRVIK